MHLCACVCISVCACLIPLLTGLRDFILSGLKQHYGKCDTLIGPAYELKLITGVQKYLCVCVRETEGDLMGFK